MRNKFMKKLLTIIMAVVLSLSIMPSLTACGGSEEPAYSEVYSYNETHHWKPQINGDGDPIEYAEHYNPQSGKNVGRCSCGYYFPCHNLLYEKTTLDDVECYLVSGYDDSMSPNFYHVEVPEFYQGEDDLEPLPVLGIANYALSNRSGFGKCSVKLESIKLHEGLKSIGVGAFAASNITECIIPNSVTTPLYYTLFNCPQLKKVVVGNGVPKIDSWTFYYSTLIEEVIIGNSVTEIAPNNFYGKRDLKYVVLPASLISLPEYIYETSGQIGVRLETFVNCGNVKIFIDKTYNEVEELTYEPTPVKDATIDTPRTTYGYVRGWNAAAPVYYKGEWHYDQNGKPVAN